MHVLPTPAHPAGFKKGCSFLYDLDIWGLHPLLVRSIQGCFKTVRSTSRVGTQYAKNLLYRTQTSIFTFKKSNFHQEHNKREIQSQIILNFSHARFARAFLGVISAFINLNNDFEKSKTRKYHKQTHQR